MNQIEKRLKERGHSDPQKGIKNVELQLQGLSAQEIVSRVASGDERTKGHLLAEMNYSLSQFRKESLVDEPQMGHLNVDTFSMHWEKTKAGPQGTVELEGNVKLEKPGLVRRIPFDCLYYPNEGFVADIDIKGSWY